MAGRKDRFRLTPDTPEDDEPRRPEARKRRGPMAAAVAETAESLDDRQAERARLMEKLKADAAAFREASADDRIDMAVDLDQISTTALERDRYGLDPATDDEEMRELKASIRARGLQQSIRVFQDPEGGYQLESGWRRLTAFRQLLAETGDKAFASIRAKVAPMADDLDAAYGRMVDENMVRKGVSHGELALFAVRYAGARGTKAEDVGQAVDILFASAARAKRYHLRRIAELMEQVADVVGNPSRISRDLALEVADLVDAGPEALSDLRQRLEASSGTQEDVALTFLEFAMDYRGPPPEPIEPPAQGALSPRSPRADRKIEFRLGAFKCTVKGREVRLLAPSDLGSLDEQRLRRASEAFRAALEEE